MVKFLRIMQRHRYGLRVTEYIVVRKTLNGTQISSLPPVLRASAHISAFPARPPPMASGVLGSRDRPHSILTGQFPLLEAFEVVEEYTVPPSNAAIVIFGWVVGDSFDPRVEGDNF